MPRARPGSLPTETLSLETEEDQRARLNAEQAKTATAQVQENAARQKAFDDATPPAMPRSPATKPKSPARPPKPPGSKPNTPRP